MKKARFGTYIERVQPEDFGLGLLWSWIYCTWFTSGVFPAKGYEASGIAVTNADSWLVSLFFSSVLLFLAPLLLRKLRISLEVVAVVSACLVFSGTIVIHFAYSASGMLVAFYVSSAATGIGAAGLWSVWGRRYESRACGLDVVAPASAAMVFLMVLVCWLVPDEVSLLLCLMLPLASAALFILPFLLGARMEDSASAANRTTQGFDRAKAFSVLLKLCVACAIACAMSIFVQASIGPGDASAVSAFGVLVGAAAVFLLTQWFLFSGRNMDFAKLVRWLIMFEVFSFALLLSGVSEFSIAAYVVGVAVSTCFDFLLISYLAQVIRSGLLSSTVAFCIGEGSIQVGWFVGGAVLLAATNIGLVDASTIRIACSVCVCVLFLMLLLIVNQQDNLRKMVDEVADEEVLKALGRSFGLTARETEVFIMLGEGRNVPYISDSLFLARSTVETHVKHIYQKTGVHSRQELIDLLSVR